MYRCAGIVFSYSFVRSFPFPLSILSCSYACASSFLSQCNGIILCAFKMKSPNQFLFSVVVWVCTHKFVFFCCCFLLQLFFLYTFGKCDIITRKLVTNFTWSEKQSLCLSETPFNFFLFYTIFLRLHYTVITIWCVCSVGFDGRMKKKKITKEKERSRARHILSRIILLGAMIFHRGWHCHKL